MVERQAQRHRTPKTVTDNDRFLAGRQRLQSARHLRGLDFELGGIIWTL